MKKEKLSNDRINVERTSVEQKEGCPNKEEIKICKGNERSGKYRVIKPPLGRGWGKYPLQQWVWRGGMNGKTYEIP